MATSTKTKGNRVDKVPFLFYDLETSYIISKNWGIWESNAIGAGKGVLEDFQILCFAYKWSGDKKTYVVGQDDFPDYVPGVNNDYNVVEYLWNLFNIAEITCAHNGNSFDYKKSTARFIYHGFEPPSPTVQIDTKLVARRHFGFTSNKLDDLAAHFGIEGKLDAGGIETWDGCLAGDPKAWKTMKTYNVRDVIVLEKVYEKMMPWQQTHPNLANIEGRPDACPKCASEEGMTAQGTRYTKTGQYQKWRCKSCHSYVSSRTQEKGLDHPNYV